jgi:KDO2-lipid IV(A) lauroyltransferase
MNFTKTKLINRIQIKNTSLITRIIKSKKPIVLLGSHYQNWEWLLLRIGLIENIKLSAVYKPLSNTLFDKILFKMRTKFGAKLIPLKKWKYFILNKKNKSHTFLFISDQVPENKKNGIRIKFFNQSTLFHKGAEKTAKLLNARVFYIEMNRLKKGYYTIEFKEIKSDNITEEYANLLELTIKKDPTAWLWSHNRWKR